MAPDIGMSPAGLPADPRLAILARLFGPGQAVQPNAGIPVTANGAAAPFGMTQAQNAGTPAPESKIVPAPAGMTRPSGPTGGGWPLATGEKKPDTSDTPTEPAGFPSETDWQAQHPAPQEKPYVEPDLKHRLLEGIFAGMMNVGQRGSGNEVLSKYLDAMSQGEESNRTLPQRNAAAAHAAYMSAAEGARAPLDIANMQEELAARRAAAQAKPTGPTLEQQYADAIGKGDQAAADKALAAIKGEAGAKAKPVIETLAQRYADAVDAGDTAKAEKYLEAMRSQSKAQAKPTAPRVPTSEGGIAISAWRDQHRGEPIENYFKMKNAPKDAATQAKNLDSLRKERETIAKDFEGKIVALGTTPEDVARLRSEEQQQLAVYDRQIHNFEQGYREGDVIPYQGGQVKITRINPDGTLQVQVVPKK